MPDRIPTLAPLREDTFRFMWLASLASNFGGLIQAVGAAWLMTSIASSQDMVAMVQASTAAPIMLFSIVAGALADNFNRRKLMLTAQFFMLAVSLALAFAAWLGILTPWLLIAFTFLIGCGTALHNPSWQASVGDMVPREMVPSAVTLNSVGFNITRSLGPAIGGAIVAAAGAAAAFAVNVVSYFALIFVLLRWQGPKADTRLPRETLLRALSAGFGYVAMSPNILNVCLRSLVFGISASAVLALLPIVARDLVGGGALTYGIMLGAFGIGAVAGAMANSRLREALSSESIVRLSFLGFAASATILGASENMALTTMMLLLPGACWVLALSLFNTTVQLSTPRWVVGRALAFYQTAAFGGIAAGSWLWGVVSETHGVSIALVMSAGVMMVGAALGLPMPLPKFGDANLTPLNRFREPTLKLELKQHSGPIVVMVDYVIDDADLPYFLALMAKRRRIRIRDGARQWALLRDLEHPATWTETYHTPTWADYVRHNLRRTQADAEVWDEIRKLHRGDEGPRTHRLIERQTLAAPGDLLPPPPPELHHWPGSKHI